MNKKTFIFFLTFLLALAPFMEWSTASAAVNDTFQDNGVYYKILAGETTVEVITDPSGIPSYTGSITIPVTVSFGGVSYSVTEIGVGAFINCESLSDITLPEGLTKIGGTAFSGCSNLISIVIPESVAVINGEAFDGCSKLTSITIPENVTEIGESMFSRCSELSSITLPERLKAINENAFINCSSLTSITIPAGVTSIGGSAFWGCSALSSITCKGSTPATLGDAEVFDENAISRTIYVRGSVVDTYKNTWSTYKNDIKAISFLDNGIYYEEVVDGTSVKVIANPDGITKYTGDVTIPVTVTNDGVTYNVTEIGKEAFTQCTNLTDIILPEGLKVISEGGFSNCEKLTSVMIPASITSIEDKAFQSCNNLVSITCKGNTPGTLGNQVFDGNAAGRTIYVRGSVVDAYKNAWTSSKDDIKAIYFLAGGIYYEELADGTSVKVIANPDGITKYTGDVTIPVTVTNDGITYNVTEIGKDAFAQCRDLTGITLSEGLEVVGENAFIESEKLNSIIIPSTVTEIGKNAFAKCSKLESITCKTTTPAILGDAAFDDNASGSKIYVPKGTVATYKTTWSAYADRIEEEASEQPTPPPYTPTYYNVTLPEIEGITFDPAAGDYVVEEGYNFSFSFILKEGYINSKPVVKVNGVVLEPRSNGKYVISYIWKDLAITIEGVIEDTPTANEVVKGEERVLAVGSVLRIYLPKEERVAIYTISGSLYKEQVLPSGDTEMMLTSGIYLVKVGNRTHKVMIR